MDSQQKGHERTCIIERIADLARPLPSDKTPPLGPPPSPPQPGLPQTSGRRAPTLHMTCLS